MLKIWSLVLKPIYFIITLVIVFITHLMVQRFFLLCSSHSLNNEKQQDNKQSHIIHAKAPPKKNYAHHSHFLVFSCNLLCFSFPYTLQCYFTDQWVNLMIVLTWVKQPLRIRAQDAHAFTLCNCTKIILEQNVPISWGMLYNQQIHPTPTTPDQSVHPCFYPFFAKKYYFFKGRCQFWNQENGGNFFRHKFVKFYMYLPVLIWVFIH